MTRSWRLPAAPKSPIPEEIIESVLKLLRREIKSERLVLKNCRVANQQLYRITHPLLLNECLVHGNPGNIRPFEELCKIFGEGFEVEVVKKLELRGGVKVNELNKRTRDGAMNVCSLQNIALDLPALEALTLNSVRLWPCLHTHHIQLSLYPQPVSSLSALVFENVQFRWWIDEEDPDRSHHITLLNILRPTTIIIRNVYWLGHAFPQSLTFPLKNLCIIDSDDNTVLTFRTATGLEELQLIRLPTHAVNHIRELVEGNATSLKTVVMGIEIDPNDGECKLLSSCVHGLSNSRQ